MMLEAESSSNYNELLLTSIVWYVWIWKNVCVSFRSWKRVYRPTGVLQATSCTGWPKTV